MSARTALVALLAFALGAGLAAGGADQVRQAEEFLRRQETLFADLQKVEKAIFYIQDIRKTREAGRFVLNEEEIKLEKKAQKDLHIYMERSRNDALEILAIYETLLGRQRYIEPLRRMFGKALDEVVHVDWEEADLDEVVDDLVAGYGVKMFIRGDIDLRKTMSLSGDMSLLAILLQIENVYDARLVDDGGELWFVTVQEHRGRQAKKKD
ncbi:MAG: hypothetical protein ACYSX0_04155 [Planctomycetota bacterium]|jgi:hypothetical protein